MKNLVFKDFEIVLNRDTTIFVSFCQLNCNDVIRRKQYSDNVVKFMNFRAKKPLRAV